MKAISVQNLTKRFGSFTAVDNITFDVEATVAGFDLYKNAEKIKKNIGYMSQKFSLYEDLTIRENIRFYGGIYGLSNTEIKAKTEQMVSSLKLEDKLNSLVKSLPLGWKQKLSFSVAMIHNPKIVFLDEPTGGVDPITRREFWTMIFESANRGTTVFITTHYMDEAEYCNRVCIMVDGQVEALGTPEELKNKFSAKEMGEVFLQLARRAMRGED
jgi:ABC-2 type transport system ATP-binding protein